MLNKNALGIGNIYCSLLSYKLRLSYVIGLIIRLQKLFRNIFERKKPLYHVATHKISLPPYFPTKHYRISDRKYSLYGQIDAAFQYWNPMHYIVHVT